MHQVYKGELSGKEYYGLTGLKDRAPEEALSSRCKKMVKWPVGWLRHHRALRSLKLQPLHKPCGLDEGLALEAAVTAQAWAERPELVRGGPWCLPALPDKDQKELEQVASAVAGLSSQSALVRAVQDLLLGKRSHFCVCVID